MRKIKFRVWNQGIREAFDIEMQSPCMIYFDFDEYANDRDFEEGAGNIRLDKMPIMQYTGLLDKHGKEIYEGDIINDDIRIGWNNSLACFCLIRKGWMYPHYFGEGIKTEDIEIIGNIYQNPELIKVNRPQNFINES